MKSLKKMLLSLFTAQADEAMDAVEDHIVDRLASMPDRVHQRLKERIADSVIEGEAEVVKLESRPKRQRKGKTA